MCRFPYCAGRESRRRPNLSGRIGYGLCDGCCVEIRENETVGEDRPRLTAGLHGGRRTMDFRSCSLNRGISAKLLVSVLFSMAFSNALCAAQDTGPRNAPAHRAPKAFHFVQPEPINFNDHDGWVQIFDGKTLSDWDGRSDIWHVEDGAIVGESSPEHPSGRTNIIWRGGEPSNFELKLEMKLEGSGANGGVQYRSFRVAPKADPTPTEMSAEQRNRRQQEQAFANK